MEHLHYNLSKEESPKGWKILLWIFAAIFFLTAVYLLYTNLVLGHKTVPVVFSVVPIAISIVVAAIAAFISVKRKDQFFNVNDDKIEFRYGIFKAKLHFFKWIDIKEIVMPRTQKKVKLLFKDGSSFVINLTWLQNTKSSHIRKHFLYAAREKDLNVIKVVNLSKKV